MGGYNQAQAHAQFVSNLVDHGMNIQAALEAPRFTKLTFGGCDVMIENRVPAPVRLGLAARGHNLEVLADFSGWMGGGQAVLHDSDAGVNLRSVVAEKRWRGGAGGSRRISVRIPR